MSSVLDVLDSVGNQTEASPQRRIDAGLTRYRRHVLFPNGKRNKSARKAHRKRKRKDKRQDRYQNRRVMASFSRS